MKIRFEFKKKLNNEIEKLSLPIRLDKSWGPRALPLILTQITAYL